jgi:hypothetical protein
MTTNLYIGDRVFNLAMENELKGLPDKIRDIIISWVM